MILIISMVASMILGGALTSLYLYSRWKQNVEDAKQELSSFMEKYQEKESENKELQQRVADLEYQLGSTQKDLNYERSLNKE